MRPSFVSRLRFARSVCNEFVSFLQSEKWKKIAEREKHEKHKAKQVKKVFKINHCYIYYVIFFILFLDVHILYFLLFVCLLEAKRSDII